MPRHFSLRAHTRFANPGKPEIERTESDGRQGRAGRGHTAMHERREHSRPPQSTRHHTRRHSVAQCMRHAPCSMLYMRRTRRLSIRIQGMMMMVREQSYAENARHTHFVHQSVSLSIERPGGLLPKPLA